MKLNQDRRRFIVGSAAVLAATPLGGCSLGDVSYDEIRLAMRKPLPYDPDSREFVRYATLAANGHNTQAWQFEVSRREIAILPDFSRRTPVVDPDDHHLYASLGCAAENLAIAVRAHGRSGEVHFESSHHGRIVVDLASADADQSPLFDAITRRQVSRVSYEGKTAPVDVLERLQSAASRDNVDTLFVTEPKRMEQILELVVDGNSAQMDDPSFVKELKDWLRFNAASAASTRDGLYIACSGNLEMPSWIAPTMFDFFFSKETENDKYAEQIRTSAGIVVFVADSDDPRGWVDAGRAYERFALQATLDGLQHSFVNQTVEVPPMRERLMAQLKLGNRRPNLVVRFGYGPSMPMSLRRPVEDVIV